MNRKRLEKYLDKQIMLAEKYFLKKEEQKDLSPEERKLNREEFQNAIFALGFVKFHTYEIGVKSKKIYLVTETDGKGSLDVAGDEPQFMFNGFPQFFEKKMKLLHEKR